MTQNEREIWDKFWSQLNNARLIRYLLLFALAWAIAQTLAHFEAVVIIFTFAAVLAFLLNFPVKWLRRVLPHNIAVILVFLSSIAILGIFIFTIGTAILSQGQQLIEQSPELLNSVIFLLKELQDLLKKLNIQVDFSVVEQQIQQQAIAGFGLGLATLQRMLLNLLDFILIAVVAFFMLLDGTRIWDFLMKIFPDNFRSKFSEALQKNLLGFFWGRFLLSLFFAASCLGIFLVLNVPYPLLLAAIAGMFDLIPGIGATLGVILVALILLPQGIWLSLTVIVVCVLLQQVEENLFMPRVMQGSINMNPVVLFFALLVGATGAGFFGLFLSIPIAGVLINLFELEAMKGKD